MNLVDAFYYLGIGVMLVVIGCGVWRIVRGPSTLDRLVGLDTFTVAVIGLVMLFSIRDGTSEFMELVLMVTGLGFFTTVCFYYYLSQPRRGPDEGGEGRNL